MVFGLLAIKLRFGACGIVQSIVYSIHMNLMLKLLSLRSSRSMNKFEVGSVVRLKSGSDRMTIHSITADAESKTFAHCVWYDYDKKEVKTFLFNVTSLDNAD